MKLELHRLPYNFFKMTIILDILAELLLFGLFKVNLSTTLLVKIVYLWAS